jgi:serine/threonine protein kinase
LFSGDFGLSREMNEVDTSLTMQVGGRSFSSPEMERGDRYDFKTDIFSVGLIRNATNTIKCNDFTFYNEITSSS